MDFGHIHPTGRKTLPRHRTDRQQWNPGRQLCTGELVTTNDPITGQGANTASKAASIYLQRILERGNKPFDVEWMHQTFDIFWDYTQWVVKWTNSLLVPPTPKIR